MGLGSAAELVKVRLTKQLRSRAVLADAPALVSYGILINVSDSSLAEAMIADLHEPVSQLIGRQKLDELLLHRSITTGKVNGTGFAQHSQSVLRRKKFLCLFILLNQEFKGPWSLRHIL